VCPRSWAALERPCVPVSLRALRGPRPVHGAHGPLLGPNAKDNTQPYVHSVVRPADTHHDPEPPPSRCVVPAPLTLSGPGTRVFGPSQALAGARGPARPRPAGLPPPVHLPCLAPPRPRPRRPAARLSVCARHRTPRFRPPAPARTRPRRARARASQIFERPLKSPAGLACPRYPCRCPRRPPRATAPRPRPRLRTPRPCPRPPAPARWHACPGPGYVSTRRAAKALLT